jgi:hypothetical protein
MNKPLQGLQANQHLLATLKAANWPGALEPQVSYGFTLVELLLALGARCQLRRRVASIT